MTPKPPRPMAPAQRRRRAPSNPLRLLALDADGHVLGPFPLTGRSEKQSLPEVAMAWSNLVARRRQWSEAGKDLSASLKDAVDILLSFGLSDAHLESLARCNIVQVCIPWTSEEEGWPERILPWEFLIVLALRARHPGFRSPTVVRHLDVPNIPDEPPRSNPTLARAWIACPGDRAYAATRERFQQEGELVRDHLESPPMEVTFGHESSSLECALHQASDLDAALVMHFLGVVETRPSARPPHPPRPHVWLPEPASDRAASRRSAASPASDPRRLQSPPTTPGWREFDDAATVLAGPRGRHPRLVTFGFRDTGPRLAALTVAAGAHAAIGFQDQVSSEVSESFYCLFYRKWRETDWDLCRAFSEARREISSQLRGTGIVLWSRHSLITHAPRPVAAARRARATSAPPQSAPAAPAASAFLVQIPPTPAPPPVPPPPIPTPAPALTAPGTLPFPSILTTGITVTAVAAPALNYSVLHNQRGTSLLEGLDSSGIDPASTANPGGGVAPIRLFSTFALRRSPLLPPDTAVEVEVTLFAGDEVCTWRQLERLDTPSKDISAHIRVPLTSTLARTLRESLRTTVETSVRHLGSLVHRQSHAVTLLAIDEWRDDGVCHVFLPSFVMPRDPAAIELVRLARRCLGALTDDFSAGFDGYQSGRTTAVDLQVRAIWAAIVQEWQLGYINPPPSFSRSSQRLRTPSAILHERAGTCIDLSLLLAACLEYVDIHPFLVLGPGHAYVGYCRENRPHGERLIPIQDSELAPPPGQSLDNRRTPQASQRIPPPWVYDRAYHRAIVHQLDQGRIVAIEATGLSRPLPFEEACRLGARTLRKRLEFDCLIDVPGARAPGHDVTPLPTVTSA